MPKKNVLPFFKFKRQYSPLIFGIVLLLLVSFYVASPNFSKAIKSEHDTPIPPGTTLIPVTEPDGEAVTDSKGNTVYEAVKIETTTQKESMFSKIINSIINKDDRTVPSNASITSNHTGASSNPSISDHTDDSKDPVQNTDKPTEKDDATASTSKTPAIGSDNETIIEDPAKVFEYDTYENSKTKIAITKYKGNASFVTVPEYIDGKMVVEISKNAFANNDKVKTIDVPHGKRSFLSLQDYCFYNCSSLITVNFYDNDIGTFGKFAVNCPIKDVNTSFWQFKFVDGGLYYCTGRDWELRYFAGNPCYDTLTLPSWCVRISTSNNVDIADNLKVIKIHKNVEYIPDFSNTGDYTKNLQAFIVEKGNPNYFSKDGVLFKKPNGISDSWQALYPYGKKDKTFTMPSSDVKCSLNTVSSVINPYLAEIYLPKNSYFDSGISNYYRAFPALKKIHLEKGHTQFDKISKEFTGETLYY